MMEFLINIYKFIVEHSSVIFSGIGVAVIMYFIQRKDNANSQINNTYNIVRHNDKEINNEHNKKLEEKENKKLSYAKRVGKSHKFLRTEVLQLTEREMIDFYKLKTVTELEKFENGEIEIPPEYLKKLENFFFINKNYFDNENLINENIFTPYNLNQQVFEKFFKDGFSPIIACLPIEKNEMLIHIVLHKKENGFTRCIISDRWSSFASDGGGKMNIIELIITMKVFNIDKNKIRIINIKEADYKQMSNGTFYQRNLFNNYFGSANNKCVDIFNSWFEQYGKTY